MVTGTPVGTIEYQESIYLEGAPEMYIQDASASPLYNPDSDGFYWNMSATSQYPVYSIGCPAGVSMTENLQTYEVLCDNTGLVSTIQRRQYLEVNFTVRSLLPLQTLRILLKGGVVTETAPTQKFGFGNIDNNQYWHLYLPKVYDDSVGDYVWMYFHKGQLVDAWTLNMNYGQAWELTGLKFRIVADTTKPDAQKFGMFGRADASVIT